MIDRSSETWKTVTAYAAAELATHAQTLARPLVSEREADTARGAIAALTALVALGAPKQPVQAPKPRDYGLMRETGPYT